MDRISHTVLLAFALSAGAAVQSARAEGADIRIVPHAEPAKLIYFAAYDAPFTGLGYADKIDGLIDAVSPSGEVSLLIEPATETYARLIRTAEAEDFALSERGARLLRESDAWIVGTKRTPTPGYRKFLAAHAQAADAALRRHAADFREALIALFGEADAYDYVGALQVGRTYAGQPRNGIRRSISRRTIGEASRGGHLYYPHPDDLDISSKWKRLVVRSDGDSTRVVEGLVAQVEIYTPAIDRVLEEVSAATSPQDFYVPRHLLFSKELLVQPAPAEGLPSDAEVMSLPHRYFEVYANSLGREPSGIFLFAMELERVFR